MIGTTLGWFRVLDKVGEGGMGQVLRAHDTRLNRDVALKVLPDSFASDPDHTRSRFLISSVSFMGPGTSAR